MKRVCLKALRPGGAARARYLGAAVDATGEAAAAAAAAISFSALRGDLNEGLARVEVVEGDWRLELSRSSGRGSSGEASCLSRRRVRDLRLLGRGALGERGVDVLKAAVLVFR